MWNVLSDTFLVINRLLTCSFANEFICISSIDKVNYRRNTLCSKENGNILDYPSLIYEKTKYREKKNYSVLLIGIICDRGSSFKKVIDNVGRILHHLKAFERRKLQGYKNIVNCFFPSGHRTLWSSSKCVTRVQSTFFVQGLKS